MNFKERRGKIEAELKWDEIKLLEDDEILNFKAFGDTKIEFYLINKMNRDEVSRARKKSHIEKEYMAINREERRFSFYVPHSIILNREDIDYSIFKRDTGNLYTEPKDTQEFDDLEVRLYYPARIHNIGRQKIR